MKTYPRAAVERAIKIQEVILRAVAKKIIWKQARDHRTLRTKEAAVSSCPFSSALGSNLAFCNPNHIALNGFQCRAWLRTKVL
jgi:hypothetical protein